jgi:paraquat-inducible protein B
MSRSALGNPANVAVAAAVALAAVVVGAWWLLLVAAAAYATLTGLTVRERRLAGGEAAAAALPTAPDRLSRPIAARLLAGLAAADAVCAAIDEAGVPLDDVAREVAGLRASLESLATRADRVDRYLAAHDPDAIRARLAAEAAHDDTARARLADALRVQLDALGRLRSQLDRLLAEMDQVTVALQAMHAEVLGMAVAEAGWQGRELSSRVGDLRAQVGALGEGLDEVYAETRVSMAPRTGHPAR